MEDIWQREILVVLERIDKCEKYFEKLIKALMIAPILKPLDWNKVFHVHIDAFAYETRCILAQPHEHNMDFLVSYASRQSNDVEKKYKTIEHEGLAMVYAIQNLETTF